MNGLTGLVLCGGHGTRMGGDKAVLVVEGEPLVLRVARRVAAAADPVLLAIGVPGRLGDLGYELGYAEVADEAPDAGPLAGLVAGLASSPHPRVAAVAVDMPFASPEVIRLLAGLHAGEDAVVPVTESGPEPLHALYSADALPSLRQALAERRLSLRAVLSGLRVREVPESEWRSADPTGRFALNLNRAEDLAALGLS